MSFPKNNYLLPSRIADFRPGYLVVIVSILVIILRTRTKVCGFVLLIYFFVLLHLLIKLYPLVPFLPVVLNAQSVYSAAARVCTPATVAEAQATYEPVVHN